MYKLKYVTNAYSKTGTALIETTVEAMLKHCLTLPRNGKKGQYGSIFVYDSNILGEHLENEISTGIILIDIDYISKETAKTIYNSFQTLCDNWPSLLAIQFSSSYYINPYVKSGIHVFVLSEQLNKYEYKKQSQICLAIFAQLVYNLLNIDLQSMGTKDKPVLDLHNTSIYQRFNLFYSTFRYNDYAEKFNMNMLDFDQLEKLSLKYDIDDNEITKIISPTLNNVHISTNNTKLKIDRYLHIGKYSGNDIRFRISVIADKLFGDNAKSFCDKFFYYENDKSIYTHWPEGNVINPLIYKWLVKNGYIIENKQNIINNWLDEYTNEIINHIKTNRQCEIIGPTGSGKTTFINHFLAKHFNSVVIVPFNVTNKLYNCLFEVNANYIGEIPENKPLVMVWDQAIKHWDYIKDRHIIIDEAHTLFFDRAYRDKAIKLINRLIEDNCHVTFITATPAGESELFNMKQFHYYKNRDVIQLNIKATKNIEWAQFNYIKKCIDNNWYDKIVLLDDTSAKKIYEEFIVKGYGEKISYIRSSTKDSADFINLRDNELLDKKITICTCVAFNGLNFKNENENILVIGSIQQGKTTSCEIIQQIGRIRKSKVTAIYFYNPEKIYIDDIDGKELKAKEYFNIMLEGCSSSMLSYDQNYLDTDYVNALKNIQEYQIKHSTIDAIIHDLCTEMKNDIICNDFLEKEYEKEYQKKWAKDIRYLISNPHYSGITIDMFIDMFNKGTKHKLIETSINNIKDIIKVVSIDELEYQNSMKNIKLYASMLSNSVDKKKFMSNMKKIREIRCRYSNKIKLNNGIIELGDVVKDVIQWELENQQKEVDCGKIGGSKSSPKKKVKDMKTGKIYNSKEECAIDICKSNAYISKYKDRFIVLE